MEEVEDRRVLHDRVLLVSAVPDDQHDIILRAGVDGDAAVSLGQGAELRTLRLLLLEILLQLFLLALHGLELFFVQRHLALVELDVGERLNRLLEPHRLLHQDHLSVAHLAELAILFLEDSSEDFLAVLRRLAGRARRER